MRQSMLPKLKRAAIAAIVLTHVGLLAWSGYCHSPVVSEIGHLPAGISHWKFGRFDLYRVNPPLVRMVATAPIILLEPATNWTNYSFNPLIRSELPVGVDFIKANGYRSFWLYTICRWFCIPFSLVGAWVCYRWACDLYGTNSGIVALILWCSCPNILGNGSLMMPDMPAAALGAWAVYAFWRWLRSPSWIRAIASGLILGVAELSKTTLIVLFPLWPILWLAYRSSDLKQSGGRLALREGTMVVLRLLVAVCILNCGYGFEGSMRSLADYRFKSHLFTGTPAADRNFEVGNRFSGTWLASLPVPLPANYLQGIDAQKLDFERGMRSYWAGRWSDRGCWYFYLFCFAIKVPLGTLALVLAATASRLLPWGKATWRHDEMLVIVPLVAIFLLVSSQTGLSIHFRYALPCFPFLFIWASSLVSSADNPVIGPGPTSIHPLFQLQQLAAKAGGVDADGGKFQRRISIRGIFTLVAVLWSVSSSLWYYPHSLSYFNELIGGPRQGHEYLLDSSISWGQDLRFLKEWYDSHPRARPFYLASFGMVDPRLVGIEFAPPPRVPSRPSPNTDKCLDELPESGWCWLDVNHLRGTDRPAPDGKGGWTTLRDKDGDIAYFDGLQPVDRIGYSMYLFHLSRDQIRRSLDNANQVHSQNITGN